MHYYEMQSVKYLARQIIRLSDRSSTEEKIQVGDSHETDKQLRFEQGQTDPIGLRAMSWSPSLYIY